MEEKILKTIVTMSIENITRELRKFSKEPLQCDITIFSRDEVIKEPVDEDVPDYYSVVVRLAGEDTELTGAIIDESNKIYYSFDDRGIEGIRRVLPCYRKGSDEDGTQM
jgi:hypothetical protein